MAENEKTGINAKGVLYIVAAAFFWGIMPMFAKLALNSGADGLTSAVMRAYVAAVLYIAYGLITGAFKRFSPRHIPFFLLNGFCSITVLYIGYLKALEYIPAAMASALVYTAPGFVILFSRVIYKEPITKVKAAAVALTFIGCMLVVKLYNPASVSANLKGILLALAGGIGYSTLTLFGRRGLARYDAQINAIMPAIGGALCCFFFKPPWEIRITNLNMVIAFIGLGVLGGFLPFLLYLRGMRCGVEGGNASVIATLEPVITTVAGVVIYNERLEIWQYIGMATVITGVLLPLISASVEQRRRNEEKEKVLSEKPVENQESYGNLTRKEV